MKRCPFGHTRFETSDPRYDAKQAIHLALTTIMLLLGMKLLLPGSTFASSHSYRAMERIFFEDTWGYLFLFVGSWGVLGLFVAGPIRKLSVAVLASAHGTLALCLWIGNPAGTGPPTYGTIACLGYYLLYVRLFHR